MKLRFDINKSNIKEIAEKLKGIGTPGCLRILMLLKNNSLSLNEVDEVLYKENIYKHRESAYKALEKLVNLKIVKKEYDQERKKIIYSY